MAMLSLHKIIILPFFLIGFLYAQGQVIDAEINQELREMSQGSTSNARKYYRQFKRLISSQTLSNLHTQQINNVLNNFESRKMRFNDAYVPFFKLVLHFRNQELPKNVLSQCLQFLTLDKDLFTNQDFKKFLNKTNLFLSNDILYKSNYLTWLYDGDFAFSFKEDNQPVFFLLNSNVHLSHHNDTITINDVHGYFDVLSNDLIVNHAKIEFDNDYLSLDYSLENFQINLSKKFFKVDSTYLSSSKSFYGNCYGIYRNQLTSEDRSQSFISYDKDNVFEVFEGMKLLGGLNLKGEIAYFTNFNNSPVSFFFEDDNSKYNFFASNFKMLEDDITASNVEFLLENDFGSMSHPHVNILYDNDLKRFTIERGSGVRGLSPIRNKFHGINIYADKLELDLVYDNCLFFHKSIGRDLSVLIESDNYFDVSRYRDLLGDDINILVRLLDFIETKDLANYYPLSEFSLFAGLNLETALNYILNLEIFGIVDFRSFTNTFKVNTWALNFQDASKKNFDHDYFKIESLPTSSDTVADLDLILNEMNVYLVDKININKRFDFQLNIDQQRLTFFDDKSFYMDGVIQIGNFVFSGKNIVFNYYDFAFDFNKNSVLSFVKDQTMQISASLIYFDKAKLRIDSCSNKSGINRLNNFPRFQVLDKSSFAYFDKTISFILDPFEIDYLQDVSLSNLNFPGYLYGTSDSVNFRSILKFDSDFNLATKINNVDSAYLFNDKVLFNGDLSLNSRGLFANGFFKSNELVFKSNNIELNTNQIFGNVNHLSNGIDLDSTEFNVSNVLLSYFPYQKQFLIKSLASTINLYSDLNFKGDIYFDGQDMNGSGKLFNENYLFDSSHHYFSNSSIMSADATCEFLNSDSTMILAASSVSVENNLNSDSIFIFSSNNNFKLPSIKHTLGFDLLILDMLQAKMSFSNNISSEEGSLIAHAYSKKGLIYNALDVTYNWIDNEFCVNSVFPISVKKFLIQPDNNSFCFNSKGELPIFKNATIIKNRKLFKDKLINHVDAQISPTLKLTWIKD